MEEFVIGFKRNQRFDRLVAANFTVEGSGAAVILGAALLTCFQCMVAGVAMALFGAGLLLFDLGSPLNFWRSAKKIGRSWISKGVVFFAGMISLSLLSIFSPQLHYGPLAIALKCLLVPCAVWVMLYTGGLLSSINAIPFWNNRILPVLFLLHSLTTGLVILHFVSLQLNVLSDIPFFKVETGIMSATLITTLLYIFVMSKGSTAAREAVKILVRGEGKAFFIGGGLFLGIIVPLLMMLLFNGLFTLSVVDFKALLLGILILRIHGDYCFRLSILRAGVYEPVCD